MTTIRPDLSVITVVLNDKSGLEKAISSISCQVGISIEHVIVDGGSADGSAQVAAQFSSIPIESKADGGIYPAMLRGAQAATGEFLIFCNAGDALFGEHFLGQVLKELKASERDWGFGPIIEETQRDTYAWVSADLDATSESITYRKSFVPFPSFIIKRDFFFQIGGLNSNYKIAGDFELICRSSLASPPFIFQLPVAIFTAGGISYERADIAWREEISVRVSLLRLTPRQRFLEAFNFCLRYMRWEVGKFLDIAQRKVSPNSKSWRDKRAAQVPVQYRRYLPKNF